MRSEFGDYNVTTTEMTFSSDVDALERIGVDYLHERNGHDVTTHETTIVDDHQFDGSNIENKTRLGPVVFPDGRQNDSTTEAIRNIYMANTLGPVKFPDHPDFNATTSSTIAIIAVAATSGQSTIQTSTESFINKTAKNSEDENEMSSTTSLPALTISEVTFGQSAEPNLNDFKSSTDKVHSSTSNFDEMTSNENLDYYITTDKQLPEDIATIKTTEMTHIILVEEANDFDISGSDSTINIKNSSFLHVFQYLLLPKANESIATHSNATDTNAFMGVPGDKV